LSLLKLKSVQQAKKYLQELVDKYPGAQEAELAKQKLKDLEK
jgi:TolA-binding protein